jgi:hypothetical protein
MNEQNLTDEQLDELTQPESTEQAEPVAAPKPFTVQSGALPAVKSGTSTGRGIPTLVASLEVGQWFEVPRLLDAKSGKYNRDNSKWAGIVRAAKKVAEKEKRSCSIKPYIKDDGTDSIDLAVRVE